jgi:hypothetical protein
MNLDIGSHIAAEYDEEPFIDYRPAEPEDIEEMRELISQQSLTELALLGRSLDETFEFVEAKRAEGQAWVSESEVGLLTIFGFNDFGDYYSMWSLGTKAYYSMGARGIRETRQFFDRMDLGKPLIVVITSDDPRIERWMGVLGFRMFERNGHQMVFTRRRCRDM